MIGARFTCNICGHEGTFDPPGDWREAPSCTGCGSSVRMRSMVHCLLEGLDGRSAGLAGMARRPRISGAGLSDWDGYAAPLARVFDYANTYYHQPPRLDICAPEPAHLQRYDFLLSSDVFEHVPPPASRAFEGAFAVLKPGGLLVLTVPTSWNAETVEHYPDLRSYGVAQVNDDHVVVARNADGAMSLITDPVFHGGPGFTLEMRLFSRPGVLAELAAAGFVDIVEHEESMPEWGVFPPHAYGLPITARKPKGAGVGGLKSAVSAIRRRLAPKG
jgi:hypothetical protein